MPRSLAITLVALGVLIMAPGSGAMVLTVNGGGSTEPFMTWATKSQVPLPDAQITIFDHATEYPCQDVVGERVMGCAQPGSVWISESAHTFYFQVRRDVFLHEIGHEFDAFNMTDASRAAFARYVGTTPWGDGAHPRAEWFAEAYMLCARLGSGTVKRSAKPRALLWWDGDGPTNGGGGYDPSWKLHNRVCGLIDRVWSAAQPST